MGKQGSNILMKETQHVISQSATSERESIFLSNRVLYDVLQTTH